MREILFRGKREEDGGWIYGLYSDDYVYDTDFPCIVPLRSGAIYDSWAVIRDTVGQYTGLTDKNGKKIFEGDIVKTKKYGKIIGHSNVRDFDIFVVIYEPAMFRLENTHRAFNLVGKCGKGIDYEVIGNIYDNPELLKRSDIQ
ncbi:MAG: YopX family protein [Clostridiales bacterium]|nr:YopX family protein [Clostridiales bacterium]